MPTCEALSRKTTSINLRETKSKMRSSRNQGRLLKPWWATGVGYESCVVSHVYLPVGYKFETLSLLPDQWGNTSRDYIDNREHMIVNNHAQYCSVAKTGIGKAKMIIGGEVDACEFHVPAKPIIALHTWTSLPTILQSVNNLKLLSATAKRMKAKIQRSMGL